MPSCWKTMGLQLFVYNLTDHHRKHKCVEGDQLSSLPLKMPFTQQQL